jgi:hypothetical protein
MQLEPRRVQFAVSRSSGFIRRDVGAALTLTSATINVSNAAT